VTDIDGTALESELTPAQRYIEAKIMPTPEDGVRSKTPAKATPRMRPEPAENPMERTSGRKRRGRPAADSKEYECIIWTRYDKFLERSKPSPNAKRTVTCTRILEFLVLTPQFRGGGAVGWSHEANAHPYPTSNQKGSPSYRFGDGQSSRAFPTISKELSEQLIAGGVELPAGKVSLADALEMGMVLYITYALKIANKADQSWDHGRDAHATSREEWVNVKDYVRKLPAVEYDTSGLPVSMTRPRASIKAVN
jgi:hypothetical protein